MSVEGEIDRPLAGAIVFQHWFDVEGWAGERDGVPWRRVTVRAAGADLGSTEIRYQRPDVAGVRGAPYRDVGFTVRCIFPEHVRWWELIEFECAISYEDGSEETLGPRLIRISDVDYRERDFGGILVDGFDAVLARDDVYTSGNPAPHADPYCAQLVRRYLYAGESVLDVGCGIGAWENALTPHGIAWTGCEARADFVAAMRERGLAAHAVSGALPFADRSFDATICIEVLEHVVDPAPFLAEVARVSKRVAIFSVPNFGAVPITGSRYALPWHMLEGDHKWFFTARTLQGILEPHYAHVETFEYGEIEHLDSIDRIPVNNHIMAVGFK